MLPGMDPGLKIYCAVHANHERKKSFPYFELGAFRMPTYNIPYSLQLLGPCFICFSSLCYLFCFLFLLFLLALREVLGFLELLCLLEVLCLREALGLLEVLHTP